MFGIAIKILWEDIKDTFKEGVDFIIKQINRAKNAITELAKGDIIGGLGKLAFESFGGDEEGVGASRETNQERIMRLARLSELGLGANGGVTPPATDFARNQINNANKTSSTTVNAKIEINGANMNKEELAQAVATGLKTEIRNTADTLAR